MNIPTSIPCIFTLALLFLLTACSSAEQSSEKETTRTDSIGMTETPTLPKFTSQQWMDIDLNQDLSKKSLQELRLLRSAIYARQGYLFMEADLRGYFTANTTWYDSLMTARWETEDSNDNTLAPIRLSQAEQVFVAKIKALEAKKKAENYVTENGQKIANVGNVVNLFQFQSLPPEFLPKLQANNFVIVPNTNIQLFHVYEQNDYSQLPSFVTTDTYLQLYHMYFSYLLKSLEQEKFIPILDELTEGLQQEASNVAASTSDSKLKALAEFTTTFFAIPNAVLTDKPASVPASYQAYLTEEVKKINAAQDNISPFLDFTEAQFPYSLFKPRGHYTRKASLQKYFKAMMWLQTAPFCREKEQQLMQASFTAFLLQTGKGKSGKSLMELYQAVYEPIAFLVGEPDNLSIIDIQAFVKKNGWTQASQVTDAATLEKINAELLSVGKNRNRIKPKAEVSCPDKINFMPQRYLADNEMMQELVDVKKGAKRAYPKGLDVLASFGSKSAEDILLQEHKEESNWNAYVPNLNKLKQKFANYPDWNKSVYNKWMESLVTLQQKDASYPPFMQTAAWEKKNLNTALASWAELKHDAILYGEQPMAAECGDGGPPAPITLGYVEPHIAFWKKIVELNDLTENLLKRHGLLTEDISAKTGSLKENAVFLLSASQKELKGQKLSEQEYQSIEVIGSAIEYLTLSIIEPEKALQYWEDVKGPDKAVAVVADIYTRNVSEDPNNGILHVATGKVNDIYVVVEIEGYLYLTKGAVFSYYEFTRPLGERLTDEEWQKILESKKVPPIPVWMKDIILPGSAKPVVNEKIFYSSGC